MLRVKYESEYTLLVQQKFGDLKFVTERQIAALINLHKFALDCERFVAHSCLEFLPKCHSRRRLSPRRLYPRGGFK